MMKDFDKTFVKFVENSPLKATGMSMFPILQSGDILYFKKTPFKTIKSDDIVLVKKDGQYFVHRVIYKAMSYAITRGDNNYLSDGKISQKQIISRVAKIKRGKNIFKPDSLYLIQSSYYLKEIVRIKKILDENRVRYVFLKGLPLHLYFEKSHPQRIYADCDILVDKKHMARVSKIFTDLNYRAVDTSLYKKSGPSTKPEISYRKENGDFPVVFDIHQEAVFLMTQLGSLNSLYPSLLVSRLSEEILQTRTRIMVDGEPFYALNKNYLIIYLALHFFHHNFKGVFRLEFFSNIIKKSRLSKKDWEFMAFKVNEYLLGNYVALTFILAKKYFGAEIPKEFFLKIKHDRNTLKKTKINIFDEEPRISSGIKRFWLIFKLSPNPMWRKALVFADPQVIGHVIFSLKAKLSYFLRGLSKNH